MSSEFACALESLLWFIPKRVLELLFNPAEGLGKLIQLRDIVYGIPSDVNTFKVKFSTSPSFLMFYVIHRTVFGLVFALCLLLSSLSPPCAVTEFEQDLVHTKPRFANNVDSPGFPTESKYTA